MRVFDRQSERSPHLVAIKRAVTGCAPPASIQSRPIRRCVAAAAGQGRIAGAAALEAETAGPKIFAGAAGKETAKQKPPSSRAIGRSGLPSPAAMESPMPAIRKSRMTISAATRCAVPSGSSTSTVATVVRSRRTRIRTFLVAAGRGLPRRFGAVVKTPGAGGVWRHGAGSDAR